MQHAIDTTATQNDGDQQFRDKQKFLINEAESAKNEKLGW